MFEKFYYRDDDTIVSNFKVVGIMDINQMREEVWNRNFDNACNEALKIPLTQSRKSHKLLNLLIEASKFKNDRSESPNNRVSLILTLGPIDFESFDPFTNKHNAFIRVDFRIGQEYVFIERFKEVNQH